MMSKTTPSKTTLEAILTPTWPQNDPKMAPRRTQIRSWTFGLWRIFADHPPRALQEPSRALQDPSPRPLGADFEGFWAPRWWILTYKLLDLVSQLGGVGGMA